MTRRVVFLFVSKNLEPLAENKFLSETNNPAFILPLLKFLYLEHEGYGKIFAACAARIAPFLYGRSGLPRRCSQNKGGVNKNIPILNSNFPFCQRKE